MVERTPGDTEGQKVDAQEETTKKLSSADQSKQNVPIAPEIDELLEHLNVKMAELKLDENQRDTLREGLQKQRFSQSASVVANQLRQKNKHDEASKLIDMSPLFDPHDFWHNQPVPKPNEKLDESFYDKAIESKTLDQVSVNPYSLPTGYNWSNLDLSDFAQAEELYQLLT